MSSAFREAKRKYGRGRIALGSLLLAFSLAACRHETRIFRVPPEGEGTLNTVQISGLNPGDYPLPPPSPPNIYQESAYSVSEGQSLYQQYNCIGCHANGGGGIGPPLIDNNWIYGSEPGNIFATIMQGRPNGMPSFRNRIPEYQAWEIVAYVRSLGGLLPSGMAPARTDEMDVKPTATPSQTPVGITGNPESQK
jgi:cytochrome c oxidase cbb3-type subunit III